MQSASKNDQDFEQKLVLKANMQKHIKKLQKEHEKTTEKKKDKDILDSYFGDLGVQIEPKDNASNHEEEETDDKYVRRERKKYKRKEIVKMP